MQGLLTYTLLDLSIFFFFLSLLRSSILQNIFCAIFDISSAAAKVVVAGTYKNREGKKSGKQQKLKGSFSNILND